MSVPTFTDLEALIKRSGYFAFSDGRLTNAINFSAVRVIERTETEYKVWFSETHVLIFPRNEYGNQFYGAFFEGL